MPAAEALKRFPQWNGHRIYPSLETVQTGDYEQVSNRYLAWIVDTIGSLQVFQGCAKARGDIPERISFLYEVARAIWLFFLGYNR